MRSTPSGYVIISAQLPDELEDVQPINLKDADLDGIAGEVATQVIDRIKMLPPKT